MMREASSWRNMGFSIIKYFTLFVLCVALLQSAPAAQTIADGEWFERPLGEGVVWRYYLFDDLFGGKQSVGYVEVDLNNANVSVDFAYLETGFGKTSAMVPNQITGAAAGINGTYFNTSTGGHRTYLRVNNTVVPPGGALFSPWGYEGAIAMDASDNVSIIPIPGGGWSNDVTHPDIMACGPLVLIGGTIPTAALTAIGSHCTSRHPRSAVGVTSDNRLILCTVDGRTEFANGVTCEELGDIMDQLGCVDALNYDGGGSTTLWGRGQLYSGVLNYPSDNSLFDHLGERSCANAIGVASPAVAAQAWDGDLTGKTFSQFMTMETSQMVSLTYKNIGTETWTSSNVRLKTSRPFYRASAFYTAADWATTTTPVLMTPASVATGQTATFTFKMTAPTVAATTVYNEFFALERVGFGVFGPPDSEALMKLIVSPPASGSGESFIVESRAGGQNYAFYADSGFADSGTNCTVAGATSGIGMRYGSTYRTVAGAKTATWEPNFPAAGWYNVYVAWGEASNRRNPITYHVVHNGGTFDVDIDQSSLANIWIQLGSGPFYFNAGLSGGKVQMTNENIDISGSMYAGPVKFDLVAPAGLPDWTCYR